ncbi:hypothetical protein [Actinomyces lilanjuaniae]|uniref:hypothetical protein n=1 Tax=Actinomyces lilanjuaniae TaxID=2321394 RepID=UPI0013C4347F|nr:hypothetical protein [Actinomyces lilanjuaniae]
MRAPAGQAPVMQVVVEAGTVPDGAAITVTGTARGESWPVRGGSRTWGGSQLVLGDALAPVNTPVVYRVSWDGGLAASEPVVRPWSGRSLLTEVTGGSAVDLLWQGGDERETDQRVTLHEVPGRPTPVAVMAPAMGAGTVSLTARTTPVHTRGLAALAARPVPVALFHNPRWCYQCQRGACDVPLVTVMVLTSVSHARAARLDVAERSWQIKGALVSVPQPGTLLAVSVWDDLDAVGMTWDGLGARGLSWDRFDRVVWQEEGA